MIYNHPEGFGIQHYPDGSRTRILGNTIANNAHSGIVLGGSRGVDNCVVANNIVYGNADRGIAADSTRPSGCQIHHNLGFANGDGSVDPALSSGNTVSGNVTADPVFVNYASRDLHLAAGSPAISAADAALAVSPDFDGKARDGSPDIGAFER
jgi:hypothetical protein